MSKRSIQFAGVLFVLAAILAVSAQESTTALNNASLNNTTLLNNTTFNATSSEPIIAAANESVIEAPALSTEMVNETAPIETALNETASNEIMPAPAPEVVPAQNETPIVPIEEVATQNETAPATEAIASENDTAAVETLPSIPVLQSSGMQIGSTQRTTFAIGGSGRTPNLFSINGNSLAQGAYEIGMPAETIMDLSNLPFFINKI